jgi:hypothetical protein
MNRYDIINNLIKKYNYKTYLEIGVRDPKDCFNFIKCETKHSVDPGFEVKLSHFNIENNVDYQYTSDDFFKLLENKELNLSSIYKWDIIFIDGLHISTQVEKDIINSLNHLSENGTIVLHDCNPPDLWHAREDFIINGIAYAWNGTVWKSIYKLRATRPDLFVCTVDTDWGIGIIKRGQQQCCDFNNSFYEYREFEKNKKTYLNLITIDEFKNIFKI